MNVSYVGTQPGQRRTGTEKHLSAWAMQLPREGEKRVDALQELHHTPPFLYVQTL